MTIGNIEKNILSIKYARYPVILRLCDTSLVWIHSDFENMFTTSNAIMNIHVSLRRMILGILIRIFPPKNPDIRAIIARGMMRFFRIFCVFQRGTRAHILIQTFPT